MARDLRREDAVAVLRFVDEVLGDPTSRTRFGIKKFLSIFSRLIEGSSHFSLSFLLRRFARESIAKHVECADSANGFWNDFIC